MPQAPAAFMHPSPLMKAMAEAELYCHRKWTKASSITFSLAKTSFPGGEPGGLPAKKANAPSCPAPLKSHPAFPSLPLGVLVMVFGRIKVPKWHRTLSLVTICTYAPSS